MLGSASESGRRAPGLTLKYNNPTVSNPEICSAPNRPYLVAKNAAEKRMIFFRPSCKNWSCPVCGKSNAFKWQLRAREGAGKLGGGEGNLDFVTVTLPGWLDAAGTLKRWRQSWPKLSTRMRRKAPGAQYMYVHEQHQDGRLHIHMVTMAQLGVRFWKDNGAECGFGFVADAGEVRTQYGVAKYFTKYLTKSLDLPWPHGWRRIGTSRAWPKLPEREPPENWRFFPLSAGDALAATMRKYELKGYDVRLENHAQAWDEVDTTA